MGIVTYSVQVRTHGDTFGFGWLTWLPCTPSAEEALREMRRCARGFDSRCVRSDGEQLVAIIGRRRGYVSADRVAGVPAERARASFACTFGDEGDCSAISPEAGPKDIAEQARGAGWAVWPDEGLGAGECLCPEHRPSAAREGEQLAERACRYMRDMMGMRDPFEDQEQNQILRHLVQFARRERGS